MLRALLAIYHAILVSNVYFPVYNEGWGRASQGEFFEFSSKNAELDAFLRKTTCGQKPELGA